MKKHAMIPVFIPHIGCPCECVFCDQNRITARSGAPSGDTVRDIIEERLPTLSGRGLDVTEIAFFGGSFTAIPAEMQEMYLSIAKGYKDDGAVDKIRLSTRPDCIDDAVLDRLEKYGVDAIELGAQSFSDRVLSRSKRGHDAGAIYDASRLIKDRGFELGLQLMIGLPSDDRETSVYSAKETVSLAPETARLYPTVVLRDTELADMLESGEYVPMDEEELIETTKEMYALFLDAGITILRVGLKSTDLITGSADLSGGYHPAFRQIVEGRIAKEKMYSLIHASIQESPDAARYGKGYRFFSNQKWFPPMIGHKACNRIELEERFGRGMISFAEDDSLPDGAIRMELL